jgi:hypothetical protein
LSRRNDEGCSDDRPGLPFGAGFLEDERLRELKDCFHLDDLWLHTIGGMQPFFFKCAILPSNFNLMKLFLKILFHLFVFGLLTLFTQIGGVLWLLFLPFSFWLNKKIEVKWQRRLVKTACFSAIYVFVTVAVVPPLAKWQCGRVPMPVFNHPHLKPQNVAYFCLLNHHYVRPEVRAAAGNVAEILAEKYPGAVVYYLDANFPFIDGYPLEPHFSHRDGKKLDVALHWLEGESDLPISGAPVALGYGVCAAPKPGETDMEEKCRSQGNWYRSIEKDLAEKFYNIENYHLDEERTREMIRLFAEQKTVGKILLEPHLKTRLNLEKYDKIRFQGCRAARHDDHIHVQ